jgi:hypothetical protein
VYQPLARPIDRLLLNHPSDGGGGEGGSGGAEAEAEAAANLRNPRNTFAFRAHQTEFPEKCAAGAAAIAAASPAFSSASSSSPSPSSTASDAELGCLGQITEEEGQGQGQGQGQEGGKEAAPLEPPPEPPGPPLVAPCPRRRASNFLVGFGSIIQTDSRRASDPSATDSAPCRISADFGYVREWNFQA